MKDVRRRRRVLGAKARRGRVNFIQDLSIHTSAAVVLHSVNSRREGAFLSIHPFVRSLLWGGPVGNLHSVLPCRGKKETKKKTTCAHTIALHVHRIAWFGTDHSFIHSVNCHDEAFSQSINHRCLPRHFNRSVFVSSQTAPPSATCQRSLHNKLVHPHDYIYSSHHTVVFHSFDPSSTQTGNFLL